MFRVRYFQLVGDNNKHEDPDVPVSGGGLDVDEEMGGGTARGGKGTVPRVPATPLRMGSKGSSLSQIATDRPIFTLSVAADLLGLHPRTLRIYEEKGLVVPARTDGNRRRYSQNDIQRFQFIRELTRGGVNLEGVRIILDMADELSRLGGDPEAVIERHAAQVAQEDES